MKVPTWASVIGVMMILLGGCGALNNVQKISLPKSLDQSSGIFNEITRGIEEVANEEQKRQQRADTLDASSAEKTDADSLVRNERIDGVLKSVGDMMHFSDYYKKWIVRIGILGTIVSLIYAIAGVILIIGKPFAVNLAYGAIGLSFASLLLQIVILSMDKESGMIANMSNMGAYFMIFVNVILLVIIVASDKSYFYQQEITEV